MLLLHACDDNWLDAKQNLNTIIPTTLADMRAIVRADSEPLMSSTYGGLALLSADDHRLTDASFLSASEKDRNSYTWRAEIYADPTLPVQEWDGGYRQILYANIALEGVTKVERTVANAREWDDLKGNAFFFRAKAYLQLAQLFAPPFRDATAATDLGLPLRLDSDPNPVSFRSTVADTYSRIITDLEAAIPLLATQPALKIDASRQAAYALMARCYLSMRRYDRALQYADSSLRIEDTLIDYNALTPGADNTYPFARFNEETLFYSELIPSYSLTNMANGLTNPGLLASYNDDDRRKALFFRSTTVFKGNYSGGSVRFGGLTTAEMLLIRAECRARAGERAAALDDLNALLEKRHGSDSFIPHTVSDTPDVMGLILAERRKELLFRGLRWSDLRRLNQEDDHAVTLTRTISGTTYTLPPNDPRYTFPIPEYIIRATGMAQNNRTPLTP